MNAAENSKATMPQRLRCNGDDGFSGRASTATEKGVRPLIIVAAVLPAYARQIAGFSFLRLSAHRQVEEPDFSSPRDRTQDRTTRACHLHRSNICIVHAATYSLPLLFPSCVPQKHSYPIVFRGHANWWRNFCHQLAW